MDYAACNIVYVTRSAGEDRLVLRKDVINAVKQPGAPLTEDYFSLGKNESDNVKTLLEAFSEVHICTTGKSCVAKLRQLHETSLMDSIPIIVLIDIPHDDPRDMRNLRTPSPPISRRVDSNGDEGTQEPFYGMALLQWIASDMQQNNLSKLVVPVALAPVPEQEEAWPLRSPDLSQTTSVHLPIDQALIISYLDVGATDVLTSPIRRERIPSLAVHAYRAHREALKDHELLLQSKRGRKRSWVGLDDAKPYAYLREAMVSGLMDGICKSGEEEVSTSHRRDSLPDMRHDEIAASISSWSFSAHDFTDDELLYAALLMLQHALSMPELEAWRISADNLAAFLVACRAAYNSFVPYHNFRHVIDVLQASFHFLTQIGTLPAFPTGSERKEKVAPSPIAEILRPFDALTLLITAIGHDVGHPGVNNAFLVTLNAPLAQLYNDRSVLESFHCAAYSQILRRHWPSAFAGVEMRQLMISSILATDMGLHFDYMKKLGFLQEKLDAEGGADAWNGRTTEEYRTLACSLIIKCADISNVARKYDIAVQWTMILTDEFARQASMEVDLGIPSALFAPPVREIIELGQSQIGFMNLFAIPLFQGVTEVLPSMQFCVDELQRNRKIWEDRIAIEKIKQRKESGDSPAAREDKSSPRALSLNNDSLPVEATRQPPTSNGNQGIGSDISSRSHDAEVNSSKQTSSPSPLHLTDLPSNSIDHFSGHLESENLVPPSYSLGRATSKPAPAQLQLSHATASAPGLLDLSSREVESQPASASPSSATTVSPSLATDAVATGEQGDLYHTARRSLSKTAVSTSSRQRGSDTTDNYGSISASTGTHGGCDWTNMSAATSATTGKLPLSPSTQGTSLMSDDDGNVSRDGDTEDKASSITPPASAVGATHNTASQFVRDQQDQVDHGNHASYNKLDSQQQDRNSQYQSRQSYHQLQQERLGESGKNGDGAKVSKGVEKKSFPFLTQERYETYSRDFGTDPEIKSSSCPVLVYGHGDSPQFTGDGNGFVRHGNPTMNLGANPNGKDNSGWIKGLKKKPSKGRFRFWRRKSLTVPGKDLGTSESTLVQGGVVAGQEAGSAEV